MKTEVILPTSKLSAFVSNYFFVEAANEEKISMRSCEFEVALGLPLGKPFFYYAGPALGEFEEVSFSSFDKPIMFWDSKSIDYLNVRKNTRLVFVKFTNFGLEVFLHEKNPQFHEAVFPLNALGLPVFGLTVKRKLRFNQDNNAGIRIIEEELLRFFQKSQKMQSEQEEVDFDKEFPFLS
ncbi:hypothetical protein [Cecembia sp.]|uniref:hypothetical protein n=1 Tax=Cecembia sp. TaxID=1898110 RepID=UPI0025B81978|nr:hypothetical protein [Cecembia sp.]